jgi:hypothetical protein
VDEEYAVRFLRREIEKLLVADLSAAQEDFRLANIRLAEITAQVPTGIPAPDSNLRITQAGQDCRYCYEVLLVALERWKQFVAGGLVPEDLREWDGMSPRPVCVGKAIA